MRKAGLLDKKPLTATRNMLETAKRDTGTVRTVKRCFSECSYTEYESRFYFRAAVSASRGILEVDLFTRKDLVSGRKEPRFRIFLDREKEDFISWNVIEEKWSRAKIDMLDTGDDRYSYSYHGRNHATKQTLGIVNRYLKTGCTQDVETALIDFQAKIRKCELDRKHRLVTDVIDGYMNTVPDRLPADWMKFINDRALEHSIFYTKDTRTGYCTHCRLHVPVPPDVKHKMPGHCRQCGAGVTYRSWKMQRHVYFRTTVSLIQKCTDGNNYVYRQFRVDTDAEQEKNYEPETCIAETYRCLFRIAEPHSCRMINSLKGYEWGSFKQTGIMRWCEEGTVNNGAYYYDDYGYARSVLYTGNITRLLGDTALRYIPIADMVRSMNNRRIDVLEVLKDMGFPYEAFWKMGLKRFIRERIGYGGADGLTKTGRREGQHMKPWEYLKITKEDMKQAVRLNATDQQMRIIQVAAGKGVRLTDGQVKWFDRYMGDHAVIQYIDMQTPHRIIRYLREQIGLELCGSENNVLLHFWMDYLYTIRQLGWNMRDRSIFFPQDIRRAHDEAAVLFTVWKDREKAEEMKEKDILMNRNAREIKKAFCYRNDEYMINVPGCYLDFKKEGNAQHNCVATYYERALRGQCIILFIRRRKKPKESFCTVEIQNDAGKFVIIQNRAAYNREAPEDAKAFMEKAVREAQKIADKMAAEEERKIRRRTAG